MTVCLSQHKSALPSWTASSDLTFSGDLKRLSYADSTTALLANEGFKDIVLPAGRD